MQREQFTHRGCHPDAEVTVALRMQTKSSRQKPAQRVLGAAGVSDRVTRRASVLCHFADCLREVANEAGRKRRTFFKPQRGREPRLGEQGRVSQKIPTAIVLRIPFSRPKSNTLSRAVSPACFLRIR